MHVVVRGRAWVCSDCFGSGYAPRYHAGAHIRPCRSVSIAKSRCLSAYPEGGLRVDPPCALGEYEPHHGGFHGESLKRPTTASHLAKRTTQTLQLISNGPPANSSAPCGFAM